MTTRFIGSYASANTSWFTNSTLPKNSCGTPNRTIGGKTATAKKVTYPFFTELSKFTADPYWKEAMIILGTGKFPTTLSFENGMMIYSKKPNAAVNTGRIRLELDASWMQIQDPSVKQRLGEEMFAKIKDFLMKHIGMMSDLDKSELMDHITQKDNRRKNIQEDIRKFAEEKRKNLGLTSDQADTLVTLINLSLLTKVLTTTDFTFTTSNGDNKGEEEETSTRDRRIAEIDGLCYDPNTQLFSIAENKLKKNRKAAKSTAKIKVSDPIERWNTFVSNLHIRSNNIRIHNLAINASVVDNTDCNSMKSSVNTQ